MATLTLFEASKRTENRLMQGIALSICTTDELGAVIPFKTFAGQALVYNREKALGDAEFIPDSGTMGSASNATFDQVSVPIRRIASDLDVDSLADDLTGGSEMGAQIVKKAKSTWRLVKSKIATGGNTTGFSMSDNFQSGAYVDALVAAGPWLDSGRFGPGSLKYTHTGTFLQFRAPGDRNYGPQVACASDGDYTLYSDNPSKWITVTLDVTDATANAVREITFTSSTYEFDGMSVVCAPSQVISSDGADGDAFSFGKLDELIDQEKVKANRAFVMNSKLVRQFLSAERALGGTTPQNLALPGFSGPVIGYRGIPILTNDNIASTEAKGSATTLSSIYIAAYSTS